MKLQAKTEEQKSRIKEILDCVSVYISDSTNDGVHIDDWITFDTMAEIVDYLRSPQDKKKDLFEKCWVAYKRKGIKNKAYDQWVKLKDDEKDLVLPHIKAYVSSRELLYQKDFERYLRDRVFKEIVFKGNEVVYDPLRFLFDDYQPQTGGELRWNDLYNCYIYIGMFWENLYDGYTNDTRPNGATIMLNNARGTIVWNSETKKWEKQ